MGSSLTVPKDVGGQMLAFIGQTIGGVASSATPDSLDIEFCTRPTSMALAAAEAVVRAARRLVCHYPAPGDTCDAHRAKRTPGFTPCTACTVRRMAEATPVEGEPRG